MAIINRAFSGTGYFISGPVPLRDVFKRDTGESFHAKDREFLSQSEFDLVVTDSEQLPVFAVEFDGPDHLRKEHEARDIRKNRLCAKARLPLLRIDDTYLNTEDEISLLEYVVRLFVDYQREMPEMREGLREYLETLDDSAREACVESGDCDLGLHFCMAHPFPPRVEKARLLETELGMQFLLGGPAKPGQLYYWWGLADESFSVPERSVVEFGVVEFETPVARNPSTPPQVDKLENGIIHLHDRVSFSLRWSIPTAHDLREGESAFEYILRTNSSGYYWSEIPGAFPPYIAEQYCIYLALKRIEEFVRGMKKQSGT